MSFPILLGAIAIFTTATEGRAADAASARRNVPSEEALDESRPDYSTVSLLAGMNVSDYYLDESGLPESRPEWNYLQAGLQTIWRAGSYLGLQANFLFSRQSVVRDFGDYRSFTTLDYAEIPLLLRIRLGDRPRVLPFHLLAGGYGAYLLGSRTQSVWETLEGDAPAEGYQDWNYGAALGLACQWGNLSLEGLYTLGLADLRDDAPPRRVRIGTLSLMLGITFYAPQAGKWQ